MENVAQKMIGSTPTDQKEVSGGDDVAMNQEGAKMEEDHQIGSGNDLALSDSSTTDQKGLKKDDAAMNEGGTGSDSSTTDQKEVTGGDDAATNLGGAKMEEGHQKESGDDDVALSDDAAINEGGIGSWWEEMIKSATIGGDDAVTNESGVLYNSLDAYRSRFESSDSSRLLLVSPTDQKEVSGGDDVAMNQEGAKMEEDHQIGSGNDLALSDSSTTDQKGLKKDAAAMNEEGTGSDSSTTIGGDDAVTNESGVLYNSLDAYRSRFESSDSSRLLLVSPTKRKFEWIPAETETTSGKLYTTNLNHREDVVDAVYQLSEAYDHRRLVSIVCATGFVSDIFFHDDLNAYGIFQITSLSLQCPADEDGRSCRNKAACSVSLTADDRKTYKWTGVNFLPADGPIEITAELEEEKSAGESSAVAAAAQDGNSDSGKAIEELEAFPTNFPAADGNINPTSTTGAANDQDKKSPSEEDSPIRD